MIQPIKEHAISREIKEVIVDPYHGAPRKESPTFRAAKRRLKADGHYRCWVCGTEQHLQVHHFAVEWMDQDVADLQKVKAFVEAFDVYGYGRLLTHQPLTSVEDVRCLMVLCQIHHTGVDHQDGNSGTGIHNTTFPTWVIQKLAKDGLIPVPQPGETLAQVLARVRASGGT